MDVIENNDMYIVRLKDFEINVTKDKYINLKDLSKKLDTNNNSYDNYENVSLNEAVNVTKNDRKINEICNMMITKIDSKNDYDKIKQENARLNDELNTQAVQDYINNFNPIDEENVIDEEEKAEIEEALSIITNDEKIITPKTPIHILPINIRKDDVLQNKHKKDYSDLINTLNTIALFWDVGPNKLLYSVSLFNSIYFQFKDNFLNNNEFYKRFYGIHDYLHLNLDNLQNMITEHTKNQFIPTFNYREENLTTDLNDTDYLKVYDNSINNEKIIQLTYRPAAYKGIFYDYFSTGEQIIPRTLDGYDITTNDRTNDFLKDLQKNVKLSDNTNIFTAVPKDLNEAYNTIFNTIKTNATNKALLQNVSLVISTYIINEIETGLNNIDHKNPKLSTLIAYIENYESYQTCLLQFLNYMLALNDNDMKDEYATAINTTIKCYINTINIKFIIINITLSIYLYLTPAGKAKFVKKIVSTNQAWTDVLQKFTLFRYYSLFNYIYDSSIIYMLTIYFDKRNVTDKFKENLKNYKTFLEILHFPLKIENEDGVTVDVYDNNHGEKIKNFWKESSLENYSNKLFKGGYGVDSSLKIFFISAIFILLLIIIVTLVIILLKKQTIIYSNEDVSIMNKRVEDKLSSGFTDFAIGFDNTSTSNNYINKTINTNNNTDNIEVNFVSNIPNPKPATLKPKHSNARTRTNNNYTPITINTPANNYYTQQTTTNKIDFDSSSSSSSSESSSSSSSSSSSNSSSDDEM